ncbi:MAG: AraC family transcriptional regulator [Dysgonamonadaceae bacterium]|jgi:AraC-like DNA-binding protein|nr:AraC family transcriptional regulator [Dysgonamonadaceae bacterium]
MANLILLVSKERSAMFARACTINFRNQEEFFEEISEKGKVASSEDKKIIFYEVPFATIMLETYILFGSINLDIFKIFATKDISISYEFDSDYLELEYRISGCSVFRGSGFEDDVYSAKHLYVSPPSGSRGNIVCCKDQQISSISFHTTNKIKIIGELLGEAGEELWAETFKTCDPKDKAYPVTLPSPDIANAFTQIINCDYPNRIKKLFIENKFREILTRIIANETSVAESRTIDFETEQIKRIPQILMNRIDTPPSIAELARELMMNTTTMKKRFKNIFSLPIYAYHRNVCLELAAAMLLDTKKSVFEIATDVGYSCSANFFYAFKKRYGISPGQYRKSGKLPL